MVHEQSSESARIQDLLRSSKEISDDYENIHFLGEGGMGTVFSGYQKSLGRKVAIKCILCQQFADENDVERFKREARVLARLDHPGIVRLYKIEDKEHLIFIVFEFIDGETVSARLKKIGTFPIKEAVRLVARVARVIGFVHNEGIVHRDIKSENVILLADGSVKVIDFGLAKDPSGKSTVGDITEMGKVLGTPQYLAPEVIKGGRPTKQSDIYALAILFFKMVTGHYPFTGGPLEILTKHLQERVPRLSLHCPKARPSLDEFMKKALAKKPFERIQTMEQFAKLLEGALKRKPVAPSTVQMSSTEMSVLHPITSTSRRWLLIFPLLITLVGICLLAWPYLAKPPKTILSLDGDSALRKSKEGFGLFLTTSTKTIVKVQGKSGRHAFTSFLSEEPTTRHLLLLPDNVRILSEISLQDSSANEIQLPKKSLALAFHKAVKNLPLQDLLFQLVKEGLSIPGSVHEAKKRTVFLQSVLTRNGSAARCQTLVAYLPILFQGNQLSLEERIKLFNKAVKLLPIDMASSFAGGKPLLHIEAACSVFSSFSHQEHHQGRKLTEFPHTDNNLMPLEAFSLGVNMRWDQKRRSIVSKFMTEVERPARRSFRHTFYISDEKLQQSNSAAIYLSIHSCEPQCLVEVVLNEELQLPFRLESLRQAYLDHLTQLGKVKEYILRRTIPLGVLRKGKNQLEFRARAPFLAHVLEDTLAEARAPGLDEVWFELKGEAPIE